jgi:hypothetical protein
MRSCQYASVGAVGRAGEMRLSSGLLENGVEHFEDEALLGAWKLADALRLPLELGGGSALGGAALGVDELFERDGQGFGKHREHGDGRAPAGHLAVGDLLLREAENLAELGLGEALLHAQLGDAPAQSFGEGLFL